MSGEPRSYVVLAHDAYGFMEVHYRSQLAALSLCVWLSRFTIVDAEFDDEEDDGEPRCEGCREVATRSDCDGVPLCEPCYREMVNDPECLVEDDELGGEG